MAHVTVGRWGHFFAQPFGHLLGPTLVCLQLNSCWNKDEPKIKQTVPRHSAPHTLRPPAP